MAKVLIIDDDRAICDALCGAIRQMGHEASCAVSLVEGLGKLVSEAPDVVFLDVKMPDGSGLDILPEIQAVSEPPEIIVMTAAGDPKGAETAIKSGAWGYMEKPSSIREIMQPLSQALEFRDQKRNRQNVPLPMLREEIIGNSPQMAACLDLVTHAAMGEANVLITGNTGTGKELIARAIHDNSPRRRKDFVVLDCSTLPDPLAESILFGHEKGAFTGAEKFCEGVIKQADEGTLFLDEIGELSLSLQKRFLRVLQEGKFRPLGARDEQESCFRLVAATNRDLDRMVQAGAFREDLLFRIRTIEIKLSPLKYRPEDIRELAIYYVNKFCEQYGMKAKGISSSFFEALCAYSWPGNVRELRNTIEGAILTQARYDYMLFPNHLPEDIRIHIAQGGLKRTGDDQRLPLVSFMSSGEFPKLSEVIDDVKRQYFRALIDHTGGNVEEAGRVSGISRSRLYDHLKKYNMAIPK